MVETELVRTDLNTSKRSFMAHNSESPNEEVNMNSGLTLTLRGCVQSSTPIHVDVSVD